jgi:hypothetical protein
MKKLKIFAVLFFLICTITAFVACGDKLDAPKGLTVTEEKEISWSPVKEAYRYLVQCKPVKGGKETEIKTKETTIPVSDFELEEGWYDVRVKALSAEGEQYDSVWSSAKEFYKEYESRCTFTLVNNVEYHVTGSAKAKGDVIIESTYNDKPVTRITKAAFKANTRVTSITIGEYVEEIEETAFYGCSSLKSVTLNERLKTIGERAFYNCRELTEVEIPDQVTSIGTFAFGYARKLAKLTLGKSVQSIGEQAFYGASVLEKLEIPDSVRYIGEQAFAACEAMKSVSIGKGLTEISKRVFYENTALAEITFAEGIKLDSIGDLAFGYATQVKEVEIPDDVTYLGDGVFQGCESLYDIKIPDSIEHIGSYAFGGTKYYKNLVDNEPSGLYYLGKWLIGASMDEDETDSVDLSFKGNVTDITPETFKAGTVGIADSVLERCPKLKNVELPSSMLYVGDYAFFQCPILNLVTMHNVKTIGAYSFAENSNISQLSLGTKLLSIGVCAFPKCASLENNARNPIVPASVEKIGQRAFEGSGLWDNPEDGIIYAGSWVVGYVAGLKEANIKKGTVGIADYAFYLSDVLSVSGLGLGVKHIGRGAFLGCTSLGTISLYDEMEVISDYTFYGCTNLLDVTMPQSLQKVGRSAFYACEILRSVDFSGVWDLQEIGPYAFEHCRNMTWVHFGYTLEKIGDYAFYKCVSLEEVALPDTVETIGNYAFYNNYYSYEDNEGKLVEKGLKKLSFDNDPENGVDSKLKTIGHYAFTGCELLESIELPDSVTAIGTSAFYNCFAVEKVSLSENLVSICDYAFFGLDKVTELELPETVKTIGMYAFKGWNGLTSIFIPSSVTFIDEHAFYGCKNATIYTTLTLEETKWDLRWNSSYRPVVYGVSWNETENRIEALTIGENTFANLRGDSVITAPESAGLTFMGWATSENGPVVYDANAIAQLPVGTTIYAIWDTVQPEVQQPTE